MKTLSNVFDEESKKKYETEVEIILEDGTKILGTIQSNNISESFVRDEINAKSKLAIKSFEIKNIDQK